MKRCIGQKVAAVTKNTVTLLLFSLVIVIVSRIFMWLVYQTVWIGDVSFANALSNQWDNGWYKSIIMSGYDSEPQGHLAGDAANWAFFPLDSILVRVFMLGTGLSVEVSGFIVNTFFLIFAIVVGMQYILLTRKNEIRAIEFALLLAFGPYTFYFSCLYTESLYLLLTFLTYYFLKKKNYILMGISGALLSATRNTGILFVFVIVAEYMMQNWKGFNSLSQIIKSAFSNSKLVLGTVLIPLGMFSYMTYLWYWTGDALAFLHIEKAWHTQKNPLQVAMNFFRTDSIKSWYLGIVVLLMFVLAVYQIKHQKLEEMIIPVVILMIMLSSTYTSVPRYMISTGMMEIGVIDYMHENWPKHKIVFAYVLIAIISIEFLRLWFYGDSFLK